GVEGRIALRVGGRRHGLVGQARFFCRSTTLARIEHLVDQYAAFERDGQHVARLDEIGWLRRLVAIYANTTGACKFGGERARFHHAREKQPLVYALAGRAFHLFLELLAQHGKLCEGREGIDLRRTIFALPRVEGLGDPLLLPLALAEVGTSTLPFRSPLVPLRLLPAIAIPVVA